MVSSTWKYRPFKMRPPRCLETSGTSHPVTRCQMSMNIRTAPTGKPKNSQLWTVQLRLTVKLYVLRALQEAVEADTGQYKVSPLRGQYPAKNLIRFCIEHGVLTGKPRCAAKLYLSCEFCYVFSFPWKTSHQKSAFTCAELKRKRYAGIT